ncbi:DUF3857 domain-containing transglutaminase family protein [Mesonia sp. K7]|uniref:DUF3857 domain-containing transglutaminase family protein n=1 Tax=Mesonia sp. K7 TaxID=2218606 RepID=UPI000DA80BEC|nr:DUF3857 domain-containing transglutaminase family protein [Mesonia sp. K7]PZD77708.1 hypothetical protein DNG35_07680 [Mesonia sp. K7]
MKYRLIYILTFILLSKNITAQEGYLITDFELKENRGVNAFIREYVREIEINSIDQMTISDYKVITVYNQKGNEAVQAYAWYDDSRKVKNISAEVFDASGNKLKSFKARDFNDKAAVDNSSLYQDSRVKALPFNPISYPYTVIFEKTIVSENTGLIPTFYFVNRSDVKVKNSKYIFKYDTKKNKAYFKENSFEGLGINKTITADGYEYEINEMPSFKSEELSIDPSRRFPNIMTRLENFNLYKYKAQGITSWDALGSWYYAELLNGKSDLSEETLNEIKSLTKDLTSKREKAAAVYNYVQNNFRYISVQIGVGGLQPISAEEVDEKKYGDCKGLSNYTRSLLEAIGIESYLAIIEAGRSKVNVTKDFPNFIDGNHMILAIPEKNNTYNWIDCTSRTNPYAFLGDFTDDRYAFVIKPSGSEIVKTPAYSNKDNYQKLEANISFNTQGKINVEGSLLTKGTQYSNRSYVASLEKEELKKRDKRFWSQINNLEVQNHTFVETKDSLKLKEKFAFTGTHFGEVINDRMLLQLNILNPFSHTPKRYHNRENDFKIQRGFYDEDFIAIDLPENYQIEFVPEDVILNSEFGKYTRKITLENDKIHVYKSFLLSQGEYPKEKYESYYEFINHVSTEEKAKASIKKI